MWKVTSMLVVGALVSSGTCSAFYSNTLMHSRGTNRRQQPILISASSIPAPKVLLCSHEKGSESDATNTPKFGPTVPVPSQSLPDRRTFLSASITSAAATAAPSSWIAAATDSSVLTSPISAGSDDRVLPATKIELPAMGMGAWAWGDSLFWGYSAANDNELQKTFDYAVSNAPPSKAGGKGTGIALIDTAEIYGFGRSETLVGQFRQEYGRKSADSNIRVATKFAALPWRTKASDVVDAARASVKRLGGVPIELYQIHFPNAWSNSAYWDGLADAYEQGLVKAVGVSNYGVDALRACHAALAKRNIPLSTNQIQFSLLYRYPLENGLLQCCRDLNVDVLSYSPLALGALTGKYSSTNLPSGPRKAVLQKLLSTPDYNNLLSVMGDIASKHEAAVSQVALNWLISQNTIPIPGARTLGQVQSNLDTLKWQLTAAASSVTTFITPEAEPFPKVDRDTGMIMFDS
jgi:pyridoxine 4-dehydrogenase